MNAMLSFNTFSVPEAPILPLLHEIRQAGFAGVGLFSEHVHDLSAHPNALSTFGLRGTGYFVAFVPPGDEAREVLKKAGAISSRAGLDRLVVIPTAAWRQTDDWPEQFARVLADSLVDCAGLRILLEPLHHSQAIHGALCDLATATRILDQLPDPVGLVVDLHHATDDEIEALPARTIARTDIVHVSDCDGPPGVGLRRIPGAGQRKIRPLLKRLQNAGFNGWWEIEIIGAEASDLPHFLSSCRVRLEELL